MTELFIHVGYGKTGTSAIQAALENNRDVLKSRGVRSLSRMLNHPRRLGPRAFNDTEDFRAALGASKRTPEPFATQVGAIIKYVACLPNTRKIIWSNEELIEVPEVVRNIVASMENTTLTKIIIYLRNHSDWIISAYLQWGIRHKTMKGPVPSFSQFLESRRDQLDYVKVLSTWADAVGQNRLIVRSYDGTGDVVLDFFDACQITGVEIKSKRVYVTPGKSVSSLFKIYNDQFVKPMRSRPLHDLLKRSRIFNSDIHPVDPEVLRISDNDARAITELMEQQRVPLFNQFKIELTNPRTLLSRTCGSADTQNTDLIAILTAISLHLHERILALEQRLEVSAKDELED